MPEATKANINLWRELINSGVNDLDAAKTIQGDSTQAGMQEVAARRELATKIYNDSKEPVAERAAKTLNSIAKPWLGSNAVIPVQTDYQFRNWYQTTWVENYVKTGDKDMATAATDKTAEQVWTITQVGDFPTVMRWAPEKVGYKPYEGSYGWMTKQAKEQLNLRHGEKISLIADKQTTTEVANWQAGGMQPHQKVNDLAKGINWITGMEVYAGTPKTPSWRVITQGPDGLIRLSDQRVTFTQTAEMDQREVEVQDFKDNEFALQEVGRIWRNEQEAASREGREPDPAIEKMFKEETDKYFSEKERLYPSEKSIDPSTMEQSLSGGVPDMTGGTITEEQRKLIQGDPAEAKRLLGTMRPQYTLPKFGTNSDPVTIRNATEAISKQVTAVPETKEQKAAWWELWKSNDVVPPPDFDPAKKFVVFAKAKNVEEINNIWRAIPNLPPHQRRKAVTSMIEAMPKSELDTDTRKVFEEVVNKAAEVPIMTLGMKLIDPSRIVIYDGENKTNLAGAYTANGDWLFFSKNYPTTFVHEIVHKAIKEVEPLLSAEERDYLKSEIKLAGRGTGMDGEEALVRNLMSWKAQIDERGKGKAGDRQILEAELAYGNEMAGIMRSLNELAEIRNGK